MKKFLNGKWLIRDNEGEFEFEGNVPGTVQQDLVDLALIPHPYKGLNEDIIIKLEPKDWMYERTFEFDESLSEDEELDLVFEGIDTLADIYLNDIHIGSTENMFLQYRFDIKDIVNTGKNKIKVVIKSPINIPKALEKNYGVLGGPEESARGYIRKAQYSYGWDWGARIATSGIWKSVYIEKYKKARLYGSTAYLEDLTGKVKIDGFIASNRVLDSEELFVDIFVNGEKIIELPVTKLYDEYKFSGVFTLSDLKLWFPRDLGTPYLYDFSFVLKDKNDEELYREDKRIGLRTVRVIQEKDAEGRTFIFEINGEKIFVKGANWIPSDNILTWLKDEDYEKLIKMAYDANMNMLRIWGGGIYEREKFYELCDELGIMVWQDFMFACLEYPDHLDWFRKLANEEVKMMVRNLRHHPSIVLWCGNNENNWGFDEWGNMTRKVDGYNLGNRLYLLDFPKICAQEDPSRMYWVSSPYGGETANSPKEGDRHVWNVWSMWQDYENYLHDTGRFISEFGFQGAPHWKTVEFFANEDEREIFHPVMIKHNKQIEGQERVMRFINGRFGAIEDFEKFVYLSQLNQAEAIKLGVEHWRSRKYLTAGTLYWQLNDSWPVVSWSCIDYFKRPKALYYYTKNFYSPVLPVMKFNKLTSDLGLKVVNDLRETLNIDIKFELYSFIGEKLFEKEYKTITGADSVTNIDTIKLHDYDLKNTVAYLYVTTENGSIYRNYMVFDRFRNLNLQDPELKVEKNKEELIITCKKPAFGVRILSENDEKLEDNFFFLKPDEIKKLLLEDNEFQIKSLYDFLKK